MTGPSAKNPLDINDASQQALAELTAIASDWNAELFPLYSIDEDCYSEPKLTIEQRRQRWLERRWLGEPEVMQDDWLFAPLPSESDEF